MAKTRVVFRCMECGTPAPKWAGRCTGCGEWNTLVEEIDEPAAVTASAPTSTAQPIADVPVEDAETRPTGMAEVDRVLGGGLVHGSVTLLGGPPGVGKSTLLLQLAATVAKAGQRVLYLTAEESAHQVRLRGERLGAMSPNLLLASETALSAILAQIAEVKPELVIIDSIQTIHHPELSSAPGSVGQVRECSHRLTTEAKGKGFALVLVGQVTKDGSLAGPKVLEHLVDTVLGFEAEGHLRLLRATKHRYGAVNELGLFEMRDTGLVDVPDASGLFLSDRSGDVSGSAVVPTLEGRRPLLVEVQALVAPTHMPNPRRQGQGLNSGRLEVVLAVLAQRGGLEDLAKCDVYTAVVGGAKVPEPAADLGIALAIGSAYKNRPLAKNVVVFGEVGLSGEVRRVGQIEDRLHEAHRLGFEKAIVPAAAADVDSPLKIGGARDITHALHLAGLLGA